MVNLNCIFTDLHQHLPELISEKDGFLKDRKYQARNITYFKKNCNDPDN